MVGESISYAQGDGFSLNILNSMDIFGSTQTDEYDNGDGTSSVITRDSTLNHQGLLSFTIGGKNSGFSFGSKGIDVSASGIKSFMNAIDYFDEGIKDDKMGSFFSRNFKSDTGQARIRYVNTGLLSKNAAAMKTANDIINGDKSLVFGGKVKDKGHYGHAGVDNNTIYLNEDAIKYDGNMGKVGAYTSVMAREGFLIDANKEVNDHSFSDDALKKMPAILTYAATKMQSGVLNDIANNMGVNFNGEYDRFKQFVDYTAATGDLRGLNATGRDMRMTLNGQQFVETSPTSRVLPKSKSGSAADLFQEVVFYGLITAYKADTARRVEYLHKKYPHYFTRPKDQFSKIDEFVVNDKKRTLTLEVGGKQRTLNKNLIYHSEASGYRFSYLSSKPPKAQLSTHRDRFAAQWDLNAQNQRDIELGKFCKYANKQLNIEIDARQQVALSHYRDNTYYLQEETLRRNALDRKGTLNTMYHNIRHPMFYDFPSESIIKQLVAKQYTDPSYGQGTFSSQLIQPFNPTNWSQYIDPVYNNANFGNTYSSLPVPKNSDYVYNSYNTHSYSPVFKKKEDIYNHPWMPNGTY